MCGCFGSAFRRPDPINVPAKANGSEDISKKADTFKIGFNPAEVVVSAPAAERIDDSSSSAEDADPSQWEISRTPSTCSTARDPSEIDTTNKGAEAEVSRCWTLACLEQVCEDFCKRHSWRAALPSFKKCWKAAVEAVGGGAASVDEVDAIEAATKVLLEQILSSHQDPSTWRDWNRHKALPVHIWLHGLVRMSPAKRFFQAVETAVHQAEPAQSRGERTGLLPQLLDRLSSLVSDDPSTEKIAYSTLVCATIELASHIDKGPESDIQENEGAADEDRYGDGAMAASLEEPSSPLRLPSIDSPSGVQRAPRGVSRNSMQSQHVAILALLPEDAERDRRSPSGLSCDAFLCAALGRRPSPVELNCYNLANDVEQLAGKVFLGLDGIWHSGLVAHGREYWYGGHVHRCRSGQTPFGKPSMTMLLGRTLKSEQETLDAIQVELLPRFTIEGYDVIELNCNDFCNALSLLLIGKRIPDRIACQADLASKSVFAKWLKPWARGSNSHSGSDAGATTLTSQVHNSHSHLPIDSRSQVLASAGDTGPAPPVISLPASPRHANAPQSQDDWSNNSSSLSSSESSSSSSSSSASNASSPRPSNQQRVLSRGSEQSEKATSGRSKTASSLEVFEKSGSAKSEKAGSASEENGPGRSVETSFEVLDKYRSEGTARAEKAGSARSKKSDSARSEKAASETSAEINSEEASEEGSVEEDRVSARSEKAGSARSEKAGSARSGKAGSEGKLAKQERSGRCEKASSVRSPKSGVGQSTESSLEQFDTHNSGGSGKTDSACSERVAERVESRRSEKTESGRSEKTESAQSEDDSSEAASSLTLVSR